MRMWDVVRTRRLRDLRVCFLEFKGLQSRPDREEAFPLRVREGVEGGSLRDESWRIGEDFFFPHEGLGKIMRMRREFGRVVVGK